MRYRAYYSPTLLRRPLVQAYNHTKDRDSFIAILRQVHDSADRAVLADEDSAGVLPDRVEVIGSFALDVANFSRNRVADVEAILQVSLISFKSCNSQAMIVSFGILHFLCLQTSGNIAVAAQGRCHLLLYKTYSSEVIITCCYSYCLLTLSEVYNALRRCSVFCPRHVVFISPTPQ
jgi:hypothetical protein